MLQTITNKDNKIKNNYMMKHQHLLKLKLLIVPLLFLVALSKVKSQSISIDIAPRVVCLGQPSSFSAMLVGYNPSLVQTYTWRFGNGDSAVLNQGNPVTSNYTYQYLTAGIYPITLVTRFTDGTVITTQTVDTVYNRPSAQFVLTSLDSQCFKDNFNVFANRSQPGAAPSAPIAEYRWVFGDGNVLNIPNPSPSDTLINHTYGLGNRRFQVTLTTIDRNGCQNTASRFVFVAPNLDPKFALNGQPRCDGSPYTFINQSPISLADVQWFKWYFDDGTTYFSNDPPLPCDQAMWTNFIHTYRKNGVFSPSLVVKHRRFNCSDSFNYVLAGAQMPENIVLQIDIRTKRTRTNDTITDSACFMNQNLGSVCLYNMYPLQGVNVPIQVFWDYADPYNPFGTDKFLQPVPPCYEYLGIGHFFPTVRVTCQGQPPRVFNFFSRIDTLNDTKNYNPGRMPTVLGSPPMENPPIYTINGYRFGLTEPISKYRWLLPPPSPPTGTPVTAVNDVTDIFTRNNHGFMNGEEIEFVQLNGLSGVSAFTTYYIRTVCFDQFYITATPNGPKINISYSGTQMPTFRRPKIDDMPFDSIKYDWQWFTDDTSHKSIIRNRTQLYGYGVNILGPQVMIEDPSIPRPPITIPQYMKNQCGPDIPVEFTNASKIYQSNHLYMLWDFADDYAPACTSFSRPAPGMGLPPYTNAQDMINRTEGFTVVNGRVIPGRVSCRFSHDTLPVHAYRNWYNEIYYWHKYGRDFPPFDSGPNGWTKDPSLVTWNGTTGRKLVHWRDTASWGKPIFTSGPTPYRIDTIDMWPRDMDPNTPIRINTPIPDPFAHSKSFWELTIPAGYRIDTGGFIFPNNLPPMPDGTSRRYRGFSIIPGTNKTFYQYAFERAVAQCYTVTLFMKDSANNESKDPDRTRLRVTVTIGSITGGDTTYITTLSDSSVRPKQINNIYGLRSVKNPWGRQVFPFRGDSIPILFDASTNSYYGMFPNDHLIVDDWDCGGESTVQLPLMKPDGLGLGKDGLECPKLLSEAGGNPTIVFTQFEQYPGLAPTCANRTFILFNYDSMLDRHDRTPCALDGFVSFDGVSPMTGTGTTPGGISPPPFFNGPNFNPMTIWQNPNGQRNVTHYIPSGQSAFTNMPYNPEGYVTVGVIIGNGCLSPVNCNLPGCLSDTVWYHKFFHFITLNAAFTYTRYDTNQVFNTPGGPINNPFFFQPFNYLRGKGFDKNGVPNGLIYGVSFTKKQDFLKADFWDWGDGTLTIDSFYTNLSDTFIKFPGDTFFRFFEKGKFPIARIRYEWNVDDPFNWILGDTMHFPVGKHVFDTLFFDTIWRCDDPLRAGPPQAIRERWVRIDSAFLLEPVPHVYHRTSFEQKVASGVPGMSTRRGDITPINRGITTITECLNVATRQIVIGVIDSCWANDTTFCLGETAFFTDSLRYWNPNSGGPQGIYNPFRPLPPGAIPWVEVPLHRIGMQGYPNDTIKVGLNPTKYYVPPAGSPGCVFGWAPVPLFGGGFNVCIKIDTFYFERIYWDFESDGVIDAHGPSPKHKFMKAGRYKVSMISRDTMGFWDTCSIFINVVEPKAKFLSPTVFNCGDKVQFFDSSYVDDWCRQNYGSNCDNIKERRWWFGDFGYGPQDFRSILLNPVYDYLKNGWYRVMQVVETDQGCLDTFRKDIFIAGPRPRIKLLTDTLGCAPYTVRLVSYPNDSGNLSVTKLTIVRTGLPNGLQIPITDNPDTVDIVYDQPGIYYLSTISYDSDPPSNARCPAVFTPDTTNGLEKAIWIHVKAPYQVEVETDKEKICVGEPFTIFNRSDFDTITRFRVFHMDSAYTTVLDTQYKTNFVMDTSFRYTYGNPGLYRIVLQSTRVIPSAPLCIQYDTVSVRAVTVKADFNIDSLGNSRFFLDNKTDSTIARRYIWRIYEENGNEWRVVNVPNNSSEFFSFLLDMKNDTGIYKVCLWAYTADPECEDSTCKMLENRFRIRVNIPNVFTPNGDGRNDFFKIDIEGEELYDLRIYNRWGGLVFQSQDSRVLWNGKVNNTGDVCPEGTYYFIFKYRLRTENEQTVRGTVTLIRD
ncbi:MAG: gliding motility-associated C-terminal domain-containing protein [Bacteroidia bacterium]